MDEELIEICPHCGEEWGGYECDVCGFSDVLLKDEYETPEGNITFCSIEQAFERGYIYDCPTCDNVIMWWEMEDHGRCIECWHNKNHKTD